MYFLSSMLKHGLHRHSGVCQRRCQSPLACLLPFGDPSPYSCAAGKDLTFDIVSYFYLFLTNLFTSLYTVRPPALLKASAIFPNLSPWLL